jgi:hypothetical protein
VELDQLTFIRQLFAEGFDVGGLGRSEYRVAAFEAVPPRSCRRVIPKGHAPRTAVPGFNLRPIRAAAGRLS